MKTAIIFFREPSKTFDGEYYEKVVRLFSDGGINIDCTLILPNDDESSLRHRIDDFKDVYDNLVIVDGEKHPYSLNSVIAEKMETVLVENENASSFLQAVSRADGKNYSENYAMLPVEATVIPNVRGAFQGYVLDASEFSLFVLPENFTELKIMCNSYVLLYLENKHKIKSKRLVLKYFGDAKKLNATLERIKGQTEGLDYNLTTVNGDTKVDLLLVGIDEREGREIVSAIVGELKENLYAEFDITLSERLFDLLRLRGIKLSVAESFTGGRVVAEVIKNSGASEFVDEGIVSYSNDSKMKRLCVQRGDLVKKGAVSSVVAYEMAAGLLNGGGCDLAIATTGIAGPKSDNTEKPVGLCFIAIGMKDGVHTYRYNFNGDREQITETAKNTALFLAIKKLKNM